MEAKKAAKPAYLDHLKPFISRVELLDTTTLLEINKQHPGTIFQAPLAQQLRFISEEDLKRKRRGKSAPTERRNAGGINVHQLEGFGLATEVRALTGIFRRTPPVAVPIDIHATAVRDQERAARLVGETTLTSFTANALRKMPERMREGEAIVLKFADQLRSIGVSEVNFTFGISFGLQITGGLTFDLNQVAENHKNKLKG